MARAAVSLLRFFPAGAAALGALLCGAGLWAAELRVGLLDVPVGGLPAGFRPALTGQGAPGDWQVISAEIPTLLPPLNPEARPPQGPAIAQLSRDATDERFPLLVYEPEVFTDFTLRVKLKLVAGDFEQMAGIAFRLQDPENYYVVRASAKGNTFRFYRVHRGQRGPVIGPEMDIAAGVWHDLEIECEGNRIRIRFDGREALPELTDPTFREGRIALWTKSDSVSYFADLRITYRPRTTLAEDLVAGALARYDRLLGLRISAATADRQDLHVVASHDEKEIGAPGTEAEQRAIAENQPLVAKAGGEMIVCLPLRDRNGDPIAAVRIVMKSFPGQTEQNAVGRATPVIRMMQPRVLSLEALTQ
ncbi:MAG: DUF1080 domain-containing protein [Verrucomicrobiales bacterium]|nr:DUF1080 domain-containing protein [Verrucomicrobiales bacterium]MCP5526758.1 DUF1080 domain-containing protein [Verrucomicrobiales bacterium]